MTSEENFWEKIEQFLGYQLPEQVKDKLNDSAFNNELALSQMTPDSILEIEKHASEGDSRNFQFLPGHRAMLLGLPDKIKQYNIWREKYRSTTLDILELSNVSFIMKELVKTAISNANVDPKRRRYSDAMKNFGIYLYMMCGKAAYEVISNNFPFPQPSTICEYFLINFLMLS